MPVELSKGKHISLLLFWKVENNLHAFKIGPPQSQDRKTARRSWHIKPSV